MNSAKGIRVQSSGNPVRAMLEPVSPCTETVADGLCYLQLPVPRLGSCKQSWALADARADGKQVSEGVSQVPNSMQILQIWASSQ